MKQSLGAKTLAMPTPVWLVGTYDAEGRANLMAAAWACICCSQPPAVSVSLRSATYTHGAIHARRAFTINIPSQAQVSQADYVGIVSGRDTDKFRACGWTAVRSELVDAPYVDEVPLALECRLLQVHEIGLHTQFVGEIVDVKADPSVLGERGYPDITKVKPIAWDSSHRRYFGMGEFLGQAWQIGKGIGEVTPEGKP
jgi:flavin reductase (DIM6/NTAB) family NADH-FMN oxidoreductase RutF